MQTQAFVPVSSGAAQSVEMEPSIQFYAYPKSDREPVKILVIGSRQSVNVVVYTLHQLGFAEVSEWTDFLNAPNADRPLQFQPGEVMKALIKYLPRQESQK